ncbi:XdhC family protein [Georgenia sp. Z1491]|uniref:XdhC family protein n=1 Tax=Georgenia sp. Z1491 TaxID=3416707 RepID=UPI003CFA393E
MKDILDDLVGWWESDVPFAVAVVIRTWSSAPRPPGAAMAVVGTGEVVGSVSGGCVEGAVYEVAQEVLRTGRPELVTYGVGDDDAFAVGLTCGGTIELLVQRVDRELFPELGAVVDDVRSREPVALVSLVPGVNPGSRADAEDDADGGAGAGRDPGPTAGARGGYVVVRPDGAVGGLGNGTLDAAVKDEARARLMHGTSEVVTIGATGQRRLEDLEVFVHSFGPPPRMLVFGAIDFAAAVVRIGKFLGYHVTVCDARPVFATSSRFPDADEIVVAWPHDHLAEISVDARTVICVLTHDPKFDVPLLELALRSPAGYVGAMGSRRTHLDRIDELRRRGFSDDELSRLSSPIGLDLGGRTPQETAVSIAAEIIASSWGGSGRPLSELDQPIHR